MRTAKYLTIPVLLLALAGCQEPMRSTGGPLPAPILATRAIPQPPPPPPPKVEQPEPEPTPPSRNLVGKTIVVDAGHGGKDPGARGKSSVYEKHITLAIAKGVGRVLQERGARVIYTRSTDVFIELEDRAAVAQRAKADLFVSIHADSSPRASKTGATIYISRAASTASQRAGSAISLALQRNGIHSLGVNRAGFKVLVAHSRPAVLVETGFLSNRAEAQRLATSSYQSRVAEAIADGIATYFAR